MPFEANSVGLGPEALAEQLLRKPTLAALDVLRVFDLLPRNPSKRDAFHHRSFGCGARVFGSQIGIRTDTKSFPKSAALFCRYVHQVNPHHTFSSLVLLDDVQSPLHVSTTVLTSVEDDLMQVIEPAADLGRGVLSDLQSQYTPEPRVRGVFESEDTVVLSAPKQDMKDQVIKTIGGGQAQTIIAFRVNVRQAEGKVGAPKRPRVTEAEGS